jgi:phosphohistidine phosphatase
MRHGDARSASALKIGDHDRPLSSYGREQSLAIAKLLNHKGMIPDLILTSPATRCVETGEVIIAQLGVAYAVHSLPELYQASLDSYLAAVQQLSDQCSTALFIGHNPSIREFAYACRKTGADVRSFECAAITCITLAIQAWGAADLHAGNCRWFITPGESGFLS